MSREVLMLADALAREKNVEPEVVFGALEAALAHATKKRFTEDAEVRVEIDRKTGEYLAFRRWEVLPEDAEIEAPDRQYTLSQAREQNPDAQIGEFLEEPLEAVAFGRIGAQAAKQVILQRIRRRA